MKTRFPIFVALAAALFIFATAAFAGDAEVYAQAKQAYQTRNLAQLSEATDTLRQKRSPLLPYLQYWQMILTLDQLSYNQVQAFLQENNESLLSQRVRELWLKRLGRLQFWDQFIEMRAQMPMYYSLNDVGNQCYQIQAGIAMDDPNAYEDGKKLLLAGKDLPPDCQGMLEALQQVGVLDEKLLLTLYRDALFANKPGLAKAMAKRSSKTDAALFKQLDEVTQNPALALKKGTIQDRSAYGRALYMYIIHRQAKAEIEVARASYQKYNGLLDGEEKQLVQAYIALEAARKHAPEALQSFNKVTASVLNNEQWEWYARAALRQQDWNQLLKVISDMPPVLGEEAAWRYWKARALLMKGTPAEANALLAKLSQERHFYGWLAAEELGPMLGEPTATYQPADDEVRQFARQPAVKRMEALFDVEARYEARLEWMYLLEALDDPGRIVAAQYAMLKGWFDLAVLAADKTSRTHNFELRYPTPYRDYLQKASRSREIDEAWVYGIIRQESRFMHYAKSSVGAGGLMQVMPATAKWIAKKLGLNSYHDGMLHDIETNVNLGTYYMRYTLDTFNGQEVMATAAYNAGPSRARRWAASTPLEGAIYAETIPFSETRNYVKKVLANAHMYAARLGLPVVTLKKRLGTIPARSVAEADTVTTTITISEQE
ncbi:transglycosylase SLT domain-containing protein [Methylophilus sp. VKM B-3414]|uniref:transglycosylase SLT domain-containing protein n=1 Tax=Methylophilus sp. VKM B-3414 TaxID=3076121 RepID=UPI0028C71133|nr:transglycosylase SLT domain-containing protein [Methylophilus sp. VKM B-3414]MDT7850459.1 transglycosylase SLT domain-containing protein [Methylophilus sp. VKM B-3414]